MTVGANCVIGPDTTLTDMEVGDGAEVIRTHGQLAVAVGWSAGIEVSGSTNGTTASIPAKRSGARFATAPISSPPAEPPSATIFSGVV